MSFSITSLKQRWNSPNTRPKSIYYLQYNTSTYQLTAWTIQYQNQTETPAISPALPFFAFQNPAKSICFSKSRNETVLLKRYCINHSNKTTLHYYCCHCYITIIIGIILRLFNGIFSNFSWIWTPPLYKVQWFQQRQTWGKKVVDYCRSSISIKILQTPERGSFSWSCWSS